MSSASDRLALIKKNYDDANDNQEADLANAKSLVEITSIQENLANAGARYYSAVASMLSLSGDSIETAYDAAVSAQNAISDARQQSAVIANLLEKFSDFTSKITILVDKAKSL